ncbi:hypothetical protein ES703_17003 [subsurface metagenome]
MKKTESSPPTFSWAVPKELGIPPDSLRLRLDFFHQSTIMTYFRGDTVVTTQVDAMDVAHALASDLSFGTGLLPPRTLWWQNTKGGPLLALYVEPRVRILALQQSVDKPPRRYTIPLPGFIFLCSPGHAPWVFAVKKKPTKDADIVYKAPLCNIFANGLTCPGSHKYPIRVADIPESFFMSYFTATANLGGRSRRFPKNILQLWGHLDKKKRFPMEDLVEQCRLKDLMIMEVNK